MTKILTKKTTITNTCMLKTVSLNPLRFVKRHTMGKMSSWTSIFMPRECQPWMVIKICKHEENRLGRILSVLDCFLTYANLCDT